MKQNIINRIMAVVEQAKGYPACSIQYNFDLPNMEGITKDSFFGIPAEFNPNVSKETGCIIAYKYI